MTALVFVLGWFAGCSCNSDPPATDFCSDRWESFGHQYTATWCRSCHSTGLVTPVERYGAPPDVNFDTLALTYAVRSRVASMLEIPPGQPRSMPPAGGVPEDDRERFVTWVACGMPGELTPVVPSCADAVTWSGGATIASEADAADLCASGPIVVEANLEVAATASLPCVCAVQGDLTVSGGSADLPALDAIGGALAVGPAAEGVHLPDLHTIGGALTAVGVPELVALEVPRLTTVGGDVTVTDAPVLAEFLPGQLRAVPGSFVVERTGISAVDLSRVATVDGDLRVVDDANLVDLRGEGYALTDIGGSLLLTGLPDLERTMGEEPGSFYGFGYLVHVGGDLRIDGVDGITLIRGFNYLSTVGGTVSISDDPALVAIDGFDQLLGVGGDVRFDGDAALAGIGGFDELAAVGGVISVTGAPQLGTLGPLTATVVETGGIVLDGLPVLGDLGSWPFLAQVHGDLQLSGLPLATALSGFFSLRVVDGSLVLDDLPALTTLDLRTTSLSTIGGDLVVRGVGLTAIPLPDGLVGVDGSLRVEDNLALTDVAGLYPLEDVGGDLSVTGNPALPAAIAASLQTEIEAVGGAVTIEDNGPLIPLAGPTLQLALVYTVVGPEDTAFGRALARGDINGDAVPDLVVGAPGADGRVDLFYGGLGTFDTEPGWTWTVPGPSDAGGAVASCDTNRDGFDEVVVGDAAREEVLVFAGWPTGPLEPIALVDPAGPGGAFGAAVACGDVNDDEIDDVIVGAPGAADGNGRVLVYFGALFAMAETVGWSVDGPSGARWGTTVASLGDANGDEYGELAVGAGDAGGSGGAVVFYGTETVPSQLPGWELALADGVGAPVNEVVAAAGDANGDGFRDLLISAPGDAGVAELFLGGPDGFGRTPAWSAEGAGGFGAALAGLPDLDGDGWSEIAVTAPRASDQAPGEGAAYVFRGSASGAERGPAFVVFGGMPDAELSAVATAGDIDWDGRAEVAFAGTGTQTLRLYAPVLPDPPDPPHDSGSTATGTDTTPTPGDPTDPGDPEPAVAKADPGCGCASRSPAVGSVVLCVTLLRRRSRETSRTGRP